MDAWYLDNLVCPLDKTSLSFDGEMLISETGNQYPVIDGMPVMLIEDVQPFRVWVKEPEMEHRSLCVPMATRIRQISTDFKFFANGTQSDPRKSAIFALP